MNMLSKPKKSIDDETEHEEAKPEAKTVTTLIVPKDDDMRLIGLFGEVEEQKVALLIGALIDLADTAEVEQPIDPDDPDSEMETVTEPIEFII